VILYEERFYNLLFLNDINIHSFDTIIMKVFMMMHNPNGYNTITPVFENIAELISSYIETIPHKKQIYTQFNFSIDTYNSSKDGLIGNYDDFFIYTDLNTNKTNIISSNEEKIKNFCAYINRLTN
jgi:hypothetical protein